jgi:hypothetical protein
VKTGCDGQEIFYRRDSFELFVDAGRQDFSKCLVRLNSEATEKLAFLGAGPDAANGVFRVERFQSTGDFLLNVRRLIQRRTEDGGEVFRASSRVDVCVVEIERSMRFSEFLGDSGNIEQAFAIGSCFAVFVNLEA